MCQRCTRPDFRFQIDSYRASCMPKMMIGRNCLNLFENNFRRCADLGSNINNHFPFYVIDARTFQSKKVLLAKTSKYERRIDTGETFQGSFHSPGSPNTLSDKNSTDIIAENLVWCRKLCPPNIYVRRKFCPPKIFVRQHFCPPKMFLENIRKIVTHCKITF